MPSFRMNSGSWWESFSPSSERDLWEGSLGLRKSGEQSSDVATALSSVVLSSLTFTAGVGGVFMEGSSSGEINSSFFFTVCTDKVKLYLGAPSVSSVISLARAVDTAAAECSSSLPGRVLLGARNLDVLFAADACVRTLCFVVKRLGWLEGRGCLGLYPWLLSRLGFAP